MKPEEIKVGRIYRSQSEQAPHRKVIASDGVVPPPDEQVRNLYASAGRFLLAMADMTDEQRAADPDLGPQHLMLAIECARKADAIERYQAEGVSP